MLCAAGQRRVRRAERECSGYAGCAFYKPKRQQEADQRRANERLKWLPQETQRIIADKYFNGEMPWRGEME